MSNVVVHHEIMTRNTLTDISNFSAECFYSRRVNLETIPARNSKEPQRLTTLITPLQLIPAITMIFLQAANHSLGLLIFTR